MSKRKYRLLGMHDMDNRPIIKIDEADGEIGYSVHKELLPCTHIDGLENFSTYELCRELEYRSGIDVRYVRPYEDVTMTFNGPVVIYTNYN